MKINSLYNIKQNSGSKIHCIYLGFFLICTFLISNQYLYTNDDCLIYTLEILNKQKKTLKTNNKYKDLSKEFSELDDHFSHLANAFFEIGEQKKAIYLVNQINSKYRQIKLLTDFIKSCKKINPNEINFITKKIEETNEYDLKFASLCEITIYFLHNGQTNKAVKVLDQLNKILYKNYNTDDYEFFIIKTLYLTVPLLENGLKKEAEGILKRADDYIFSENRGELFSFELCRLLLDKYIQLNRQNEISKLIKKIKQEAYVQHFPDLLYLVATMFKLERFSRIENILELIINYFENIKDGSKMISELLTFIVTQELVESGIIKKYLLKTNLAHRLIKIIKKNIKYKFDKKYFEHIGEFESFNREIIKFLVQIGFWKEAKEIANKLGNYNNTFRYKDYFYYYMGLQYLESEAGLSTIWSEDLRKYFIFELVNNIKEYFFLRIELFLKGAEFCHKRNDEKGFETLMERAVKIIKNKKLKNRGYCLLILPNEGDIAMAWLHRHFPEKALDIVRFIEDDNNRDIILFQIGQYYIIRNNMKEFKKIVKMLSFKSKILNLISSKIAAKLMCESKQKEANELFKVALKNEIEGKGYYFKNILNTYINAKKFDKIVVDELWESF